MRACNDERNGTSFARRLARFDRFNRRGVRLNWEMHGKRRCQKSWIWMGGLAMSLSTASHGWGRPKGLTWGPSEG